MNEVLQYQAPDARLLAINRSLSKGMPSCPITLTVGGLVIAGTLISMASISNNTVMEQPAQVSYSDFEEITAELAAASQRNDEYLLLKDATVFSGASQIKLPFWRGRIASVDGYCLNYQARLS